MPWIKTDDQMVDHPKYDAVSSDAFKWAHRGLSYANRFLTDGHLPVSFTAKVPEPVMTELTTVVAGQRNPIWHRNADCSVEIHDFHDYNLKKTEVEKERRKARQRQAKWRKTKGNVSKSRHAVTNALVTPTPTRSRPGTKDPPNPRARGGSKATRRELQKAAKTLKAFRDAEQERRLESGGPRFRMVGTLRQQYEALAEIGLTLQDLYEPKACMHVPCCDDVDDCLLRLVADRRDHEARLLEHATAGPKPVAKAKAS